MNQQEIIERLTAQLIIKRDAETEIKYLINELVRVLTPTVLSPYDSSDDESSGNLDMG